MNATVWRFCVRPENVDAFEQASGPRGDWARLFARVEGYVGTELLKLDEQSARYLTLDRWRSREHLERAKTLLAADYAQLDRRCEAYTSEETWLGTYGIFE
jgi:heme-degrading monooxygenase HmoA